jgi:hypothetical protein
VSDFIETIRKEWATIRGAPWSFLTAIVVVGGALWIFMELIHSGEISGKDATIEAQKAQIESYKDKLSGATPGANAEQKPGKPLMSDYGVTGGFFGRRGHPEDVPTGQASHIKLDGNRLIYLDPKKYRLMGVLYHVPPNIDHIDVSGISKSNEFDIRDEQIDIEIPWNQKFINEFASGETISAYALLAIPVGVTGDQFDTLRQAQALGARILEERGGPP